MIRVKYLKEIVSTNIAAEMQGARCVWRRWIAVECKFLCDKWVICEVCECELPIKQVGRSLWSVIVLGQLKHIRQF